MVLAIRKILLQKVKERLCGGLLRVPLFVTRLGQHTDLPSFCMHINSDVNLLSFEGNFVSLHIGTVLIVCHLSFALQIYNPIIIVPTFSLQTMKTPRWFAMRPEARSLRRAESDLSQCVSLYKHSNLSFDAHLSIGECYISYKDTH